MEKLNIRENKNTKHKLLYFLAEADLFEMVEKSGYGEREFLLFQKRRLMKSLMASLVALIPAFLINRWFLLSGVVFGLYMWRAIYTKEKKEYQDELVAKTLIWYMYERLMVVYLYENVKSVYSATKDILDRLKSSEFKQDLYRFALDMTYEPESVEPYIMFANKGAGGTDKAQSFMISVYNYQRKAKDSSILDELSDTARKEMIEGMKTIRKAKERPIYMVATYFTMLNVIPMFGYMGGSALHLFTNSANF